MSWWLRRIIAVAQIGGGFMGSTLIIVSLMSEKQDNISGSIQLFFAALFGFGIIAGVALIESSKYGILLSKIYQVIQIPILTSPIVQYAFCSGLFGTVNFSANGFNWDLFVGSRYVFFIGADVSFGFGLNLVAIFFFLALVKMNHEKRRSKIMYTEQLQNQDVTISPVRRSRKNEYLYAGSASDKSD